MEKNFQIPEGLSPRPGIYSFENSPYFIGVSNALDDPGVDEVVLVKAAQIGWTFFLIGYIAKRVENDPCPIIALFAKEKDGKNFHDEKLVPVFQATQIIRKLVDVGSTRKSGNRWDMKTYPGGFLKLVASNSPGNVKSTSSVGVGVVEEPDDTSENVKDQGDSIGLLEERLKRYPGSKMIVGGTPAVKGLSKTIARLDRTDKRVLPIRCHDCGETHVLDWVNVDWYGRDGAVDIDESTGEVLDGKHKIYGFSKPETSVYVCPHCQSEWDDYQRQQNIKTTIYSAVDAGDKNAGWVATAEFDGKAGFMDLSELYVCLPGTTLADVVRDFLNARYHSDQGDESQMIKFVNQKLGQGYEYKTADALDEDALWDRCGEYSELTAPRGVLILTAGVDLQHDRIALIIKGWGREEESWLLFAGEEYGDVKDKKDPVWDWLAKMLKTPVPHEVDGVSLIVRATTVDCSDGNTSDAGYSFVRKYQQRGVMAGKGSSNDYGSREIFARPRSVDTRGGKNTKISKYGLQVYIIGTHKSKDLVDGRMKLVGSGPGRMHYYQRDQMRADYFKQMVGEVKAPSKTMRNKKIWQQKVGCSVEFWDCEQYALHAARSLGVHIMTDAKWDTLEKKIMQVNMFTVHPQLQATGDSVEKEKPERSRRDRSSRRSGNRLNG